MNKIDELKSIELNDIGIEYKHVLKKKAKDTVAQWNLSVDWLPIWIYLAQTS